MTAPGGGRRSSSSGRAGRGTRARTRRRRPRRPVRRYGSHLSRRERVLLALLFLAVQVAFFLLVDDWSARVGVLLLSLFALPLVITLWLSPRSSR